MHSDNELIYTIQLGNTEQKECMAKERVEIILMGDMSDRLKTFDAFNSRIIKVTIHQEAIILLQIRVPVEGDQEQKIKNTTSED